LFMAKNDNLNVVVTGMSDHHIDPYSAVEKIVSKLMPGSTD